MKISCSACGGNVTYQGTFSLWWDWKTESWNITGALCWPCLHKERLTGAPQATLGVKGATLGTAKRPVYQAGELTVRVSQNCDNVARVVMVPPSGKPTGPAEAVIRRVELWRPGAEGPDREVRPFRLILWLEVSDFFPVVTPTSDV